MADNIALGAMTFGDVAIILGMNHIIMNLPKSLLNVSGSATILNIIFIFIIVLCIVYFICKVMKRFPNQDILDIASFLGGNILKNIIDYYEDMTLIFVSHRRENRDLFHQNYTLEGN